MSKGRKNHSKETFEPKIGFENCGEKELSFSFSELDLQGNVPKANSFFSESDREVAETPQEESRENEVVNVSNGLNHAFFEENSESLSIREPVRISKEINENVEVETTKVKALRRSESENSDANEIILSNTEAPLKKENQPKPQPVVKSESSSRKKKGCCKCASCNIF